MKIIKRSKLIAAQELNQFLLHKTPYFAHNDNMIEDEYELEIIRDFSEAIIDLRDKGGLFVTPEFSKTELQNTFDFVEFLEKEEYEKLIEYKIVEDI